MTEIETPKPNAAPPEIAAVLGALPPAQQLLLSAVLPPVLGMARDLVETVDRIEAKLDVLLRALNVINGKLK